MRTRIERLWPLLALALVAAILLLSFPYLASAYYLEAGGRTVRAAITDVEASPSAIALLNRSLTWNSENAQAYRLLAYVQRATGDWPAAIESLTRYTELRPKSMLGYVEFAQLYEEIDLWTEATDQLDLIKLLPEADVRTPAYAIDTQYADSGEEIWHGYVAETAFALPPEIHLRPTLFMHPPSQVTYTLQLPAQPAVLDFAMGMDPQTADWPGDGVTFEVVVNGEKVFFEHLDKDMAREGWHRRRVKLDSWAGHEIALSLVTSAGPALDTTGDWAGWGTPRVADAELLRLQAMGLGERAIEAWRLAGYTQAGAIDLARAAQTEGREREALAWFRRALALQPELGDAWHALGLWYQEHDRWADAAHAFEQAVTIGRFERVSASDPAYHAGLVYQLYLDSPDRYRAWALYDKALALNEFSTRDRLADCHYRRGDILRLEGRNVDEYIAAFKAAVAANPRHAWAHARLGYAYYERNGDVAAAEAELNQALALAPQNKWMYVILGDVYRLEGRTEEARTEYEQALDLDPDFREVHIRIQAMDNGR